MTTQLQAFVLGTDGNLWLETGPFGNLEQTIANRLQIDANVSNLYSQVGENHIWRTAFQALNPGEIFVCGTDGNLWLEHAPFNSVPPSRIQVDGSVETFQAMDLGTAFVLGNDGNLWLENAPFGNVPPHRVQVDGNVLGFQALDLNTVFVLGTDGNLWLEYAPFGQQVPPKRLQVDGNVLQFWAMDEGTVYVLGSDLNFWYEIGPFGNVDLTTSTRTQIDSDVNDFQPMRSSTGGGGTPSGSAGDTVFILKHDGSLWLAQGPYSYNNPHDFVNNNLITFGAEDPSSLFVIDGNLDLWQMTAPYSPQNTVLVDKNVVACQPLFPQQQLFGLKRPFHVKRPTH